MPNVRYNFDGKVVIITGSSSGIGAATAIKFAEAGADVVITSNNVEQLSEVAEKVHKISFSIYSPLQVVADVTKEEDCKRIVESTIKEFGRIDILVNNAGCQGLKAVTDSDYMDVFKHVLETNLYSVVYLTHLCVEYLAKTNGNIINISSVQAIQPFQFMSSYAVSKSGVNMFTKCMAAELGAKGIRVNSVCPGAVKTDCMATSGLSKDQIENIWEEYANKYPVRRYGVPEDIANDILFLASEESSFKTGTVLVSDGGHLAANVSLSLK